jgi:hypothetical protein
MGQYASKCCKKATPTDTEKVPLVDVEKGGKAGGAGAAGKAGGRAGDDSAAEGGQPIEPDPAVFYAKSTPHSVKTSSRGGGGVKKGRAGGGGAGGNNNDTARETGSSTSAKRNKVGGCTSRIQLTTHSLKPPGFPSTLERDLLVSSLCFQVGQLVPLRRAPPPQQQEGGRGHHLTVP